MSRILCLEDGRGLTDERVIVGLLGHSDFQIVRPEETLVSMVVCRHHFQITQLPMSPEGFSFYDIKEIQTWDMGLVFSITQAKSDLSLHDDTVDYEMLKRDGVFNHARYLPSFAVEGHTPLIARTMFQSLYKSSDERLNMLRLCVEKHERDGGARYQEQMVHSYLISKRNKEYQESLARAHALKVFVP